MSESQCCPVTGRVSLTSSVEFWAYAAPKLTQPNDREFGKPC
jgi:hypothetical protein